MNDTVIAFYGGDSNIGTSQIAHSAAEIIASAGEKLLFIDASGGMYRGYSGIENINDVSTNMGIDSIGAVTSKQAVYSNDLYSVVLGCKQGKKKEYNREFFSDLVETGKYDRVIIDCGSDARDSLSLAALKFADKRYFIVRQNPKCIEKFRNITETVLLPEGVYLAKDVLLINAERKSNMLYTDDQVFSSLKKNGMNLPYIRTGMKCEYSGKTLAASNKKYRKMLETILKSTL